MQFTDYDKITDTLMWFDNNISLTFTTALSKKDKDGNRNFFHYETSYPSRYIGQETSTNIKRMMIFYFGINCRNKFEAGIMLLPKDVIMLCLSIKSQLLPLYFDSAKRIYKIVDNKMVISGDFNPVVFAQNEYSYLSFEPIVLTYENNTMKEGVRLTVNDEFADIDIDKFMGFYYLLSRTDMYNVACSMASYAKMEPYNINQYSCKGLAGGGPLPEETWISVNEKTKNEKQSNKFLDDLRRK